MHSKMTCLEVESDACNVIYASQNTSAHISSLNSILYECRDVLAESQLVRIKHVFREENHCEDKLAKMGLMASYDIFTFDCIPSVLETLVVLDKQRAVSSVTQTARFGVFI